MLEFGDDLQVNRPLWEKDESVTVCRLCKVKFSFFVRKHHCRRCGKIVCASCSPHFIPLHQYGYHKPTRVCKKCYAKETELSQQGVLCKSRVQTFMEQIPSDDELIHFEQLEALLQQDASKVTLALFEPFFDHQLRRNAGDPLSIAERQAPGRHIILFLIQYDKMDLLEYALDRFPGMLKASDQGSCHAGHYCAKYNRPKILTKLMELGFDPMVKDLDGMNPLMVAVELNQKDVADLLLGDAMGEDALPVDVTQKSNAGSTAFSLALKLPLELDVVYHLTALLDHPSGGNKVILARDSQGQNLIHSIASRGCVVVLKAILARLKEDERERAVNAVDTAGNTPLHSAAGGEGLAAMLNHEGLFECCVVLLEAGGMKNMKNKKGEYAYQMAGNARIQRVLKVERVKERVSRGNISRVHVVLPTDTWIALSMKYGVTVEDLKAENGIVQSNTDIFAYSEIRLPPHARKEEVARVENREVTQTMKNAFINSMMVTHSVMKEEARSYLELADWDLSKAQLLLKNSKRWAKEEPEEMASIY